MRRIYFKGVIIDDCEPRLSSDILKQKSKPRQKLNMKKVRELIEAKKKLYSKS